MSSKYEWPESYIDRFFTRMSTIWPGWGKGVDQTQWRIEWRAVLEEMDPNLINDVINHCRDEFEHKPAFKEVQYVYYHVVAKPERTYYRAPEPAQQPPSASQSVNRRVDTILSRLGAPTVRRWVPPSSQYAAALQNAKNDGRSAYEVDVEFLDKNGWTAAHERQYLHDVSVIAFGQPERFFPVGHQPHSIEWAMELIK